MNPRHDWPRLGSLASLLSCHTARCGVKWGLRPQDTRAAQRNNQSLHIPPYASSPCETLIGEPYPNQHIEDENSGLATQPEAVSVVRLEPYHGLTTEALLHGKGWRMRESTDRGKSGEIYKVTSVTRDSRSPASIFHGTEMIP